jgi:hypothetical protein
MFVIRRDSGDSDGHNSGSCQMWEKEVQSWCITTPTYTATVHFLVFGTWGRHYRSMQFMKVVCFKTWKHSCLVACSTCWFHATQEQMLEKKWQWFEGGGQNQSSHINPHTRHKGLWSAAVFPKLRQLQTATWAVRAYAGYSAGLSHNECVVASFLAPRRKFIAKVPITLL